MKSHTIIFFVIGTFLFTSCVSKRKYDDLRNAEHHLKREIDGLKNNLQLTQSEYTTLANQHAAESSALREQNQQLLTQATDLSERLSTTTTALMTAKNELVITKTALDNQSNQLGGMASDLEARSRRIAELEQVLEEQNKRVQAIRSAIDRTLRGFSPSDLSVREENGKLYVSLSQNLLFTSGSKAINPKGKEAIRALAGVLIPNPDIEITVEGHTDTDGDASSNWDLSVGRAVNVVRELSGAGVDPSRIAAAGRGQYHPVSTNSTKTGKAENRRTEIILNPNLGSLYQIIGQ